MQLQFNLLATSLKSHYHLFGATGDTLTTLATVQVFDQWVWPTPVIFVLSLGLNYLKLTKSKIDFETNTVETG